MIFDNDLFKCLPVISRWALRWYAV